MNGIILAGGKSLRFGEDKAFVKVGDFILIESLIGLLTPLFDNLIIVTNYPEKYVQYPVKVVVDQIKDLAPLAGIQAGLLASDADYNFVMACDMPLVKPSLIRYLMSKARADIVVPRRGKNIEPLCAVYSKNCLTAIEALIKTGNYKIHAMFDKLNVDYVEDETIKQFDPGFLSFLNLNFKKDLEKINLCLSKQKLSVLT